MRKKTDVFRFVSLRPVQRANDKDVDHKLIKAYGPPDNESPFHRELLGDNREFSPIIVKRFIASSNFVSNLSTIDIPIAPLDRWLLSQGDRPNPDSLTKQVERLTDMEPNQLIEGATYREARQRVADSLLALTILSEFYFRERSPEALGIALTDKDRIRDELLRAMYIFGLLERLALKPSPFKNADDIHELLVNGIILLPRYVFFLPPTALARTPGVADLIVTAINNLT